MLAIISALNQVYNFLAHKMLSGSSGFAQKKHKGTYQMLRNAIIFNNIISKHFFSALILQEYDILCTVQTLNISYTKHTARD